MNAPTIIRPDSTSILSRIHVHDDILDDALGYRARVLAMPRRSHTLAEGVTFHGLAQIPDRTISDWIAVHYPALTITLALTRLSPAGQAEPNNIHDDRQMGEWTGIVYLNPDVPPGDGTKFYRHRETGSDHNTSTTVVDMINMGFEWRNLDAWECIHQVEARFGRLVLFPASAYHSRAIFDNFGSDDETARLIHICWGSGELPQEGEARR